LTQHLPYQGVRAQRLLLCSESNTLEGIWTGLRNDLRISRGVSKHYLAQYVAIFLWSYNIKAVCDEFLRVLMGIEVVTDLRT